MKITVRLEISESHYNVYEITVGNHLYHFAGRILGDILDFLCLKDKE